MKELCILIFFLLPAFVFGQDKILFTNGIQKEGSILYRDNKWIYYGARPKPKVNEKKLVLIDSIFKTEKVKIENNVKKNSLQKSIAQQLLKRNEVRSRAKAQYAVLVRVAADNVFSVTHADGREEIIYSPDTLGFLVMDVVEPELDLTVDEMRRYIYGRQDGMKVSGDKAMNVSMMVSAIGGGLGAFYGPIAPSIYIIILGTTKQKPNEKLVAHPEYIFDENYLAGYNKSARKRKIIAATGGGLIGLGLGIIYYQTAFRGWK